jgi:hypothetical protein
MLTAAGRFFCSYLLTAALSPCTRALFLWHRKRFLAIRATVAGRGGHGKAKMTRATANIKNVLSFAGADEFDKWKRESLAPASHEQLVAVSVMRHRRRG